ncbi:PhzF family phenazine biosynthesis protein [Inquilinus sp. CAU 1745]|uniref:PhzF family phenazine biosynthesis protein n=1 Tax=Inquilinus sp. CAU 1745 TaxID=3140369 RepID=UPI00325ADE3E
MHLDYVTADVFTDRPLTGNPLAVVLDADGLSGRAMQRIAGEFNLSETVFVLKPRDPDAAARLRIFTPARELPFAGHPTVGAAVVLAGIGAIEADAGRVDIIFEEGVGPVPVTVDGRAGWAQLSVARLPEEGPAPPDRAALARILSLTPDDFPEGEPARSFSCGAAFPFVPVRDREALARARIDSAAWSELMANDAAPDPYLFCRDPERLGSHIRARLFAPAMGITEDPATGSAAAALAGYLTAQDRYPDGTARWVVEQGFEMGRPSILEVEADIHAGKATAVRVGGSAVIIARGQLTIPDDLAREGEA